MLKGIAGAALALSCLLQPANAQNIRTVKPVLIADARGASHETLDASMARLAMKAALQPSSQPTQQELLGIILLMSLREQKDRHI
jgi:hypothetical protein